MSKLLSLDENNQKKLISSIYSKVPPITENIWKRGNWTESKNIKLEFFTKLNGSDIPTYSRSNLRRSKMCCITG